MARYIKKFSMKQFWKYVTDTIKIEDWENLSTILKCSPHRLTKLKNGNTDFTIAEIEAIASILGEEPVELSAKFQLGYKRHTVDEMTTFAARHGHGLQVQYTAA